MQASDLAFWKTVRRSCCAHGGFQSSDQPAFLSKAGSEISRLCSPQGLFGSDPAVPLSGEGKAALGETLVGLCPDKTLLVDTEV